MKLRSFFLSADVIVLDDVMMIFLILLSGIPAYRCGRNDYILYIYIYISNKNY